ncbi:MAG: alpha/beta fold hydrolase [Puniceicoccales bacterium]|jgi:pimeloyl-ACP methyl ester carboxylesterase|nr:alpha/beta fold hydrolase [Puniceicoccales bacterium]
MSRPSTRHAAKDANAATAAATDAAGGTVAVGVGEHAGIGEHAGEHVILLHGIACRPIFMRYIATKVAAAGYTTHNTGYPSRTAPIARLADAAIGAAIRDCENAGAKAVHFVTHSMGGILLRSYLARHSVPFPQGRAVMLAPPNHGSEVADALRSRWLFRKFFGAAGQELGTTPDATPNRLGPPPVGWEVGIIAGSRSCNFLFSTLWLPAPDDGTVSVASTHLEGMKDHCIIPATHTFMSRNRTVISQTLHFLHHGLFKH